VTEYKRKGLGLKEELLPRSLEEALDALRRDREVFEGFMGRKWSRCISCIGKGRLRGLGRRISPRGVDRWRRICEAN